METAFELTKRDLVVTELKCFICGMKTGCNECKECIKQEEAFHNYKQSFAAKTMKYLNK